jgi:hypothetical protein
MVDYNSFIAASGWELTPKRLDGYLIVCSSLWRPFKAFLTLMREDLMSEACKDALRKE